MAQRAAVLAIGTEITSGEVVNGNASWLAQHLEQLGLTVDLHLAVPDDRDLIQQSLNWARDRADVVFVTGGLGPTSDDFTREEVAKWCRVENEFSSDAWAEMQALYVQRSLTIRPAHQQQCFFPAGSKIVRNIVGTAHGFYLQQSDLHLFVLPGPPREIHEMWRESVLQILEPLCGPKTRELKSWTLLGITESEAAEITEKVMADSGCTLGYRASVPYVQVKVWMATGDGRASALTGALEAALAQWLVSRGSADPATECFKALLNLGQPKLVDQLTNGNLATRLGDWLKRNRTAIGADRGLSVLSTWGDVRPELTSDYSLAVRPAATSRQFNVELRTRLRTQQALLTLPFGLEATSDRGRLYVSEMALHWWKAQINGSTGAS